MTYRMTGYDIHHAAHRIAAVEHTCRTTQHLYALGHQRLIAVADRMAIDALILRMAVDEHHQLAGATCDAT